MRWECQKFILEEDFNTAFRKNQRNKAIMIKKVISVNERVQVFYGLLSGQYFRVVPIQNDPNHTWNSWLDAEQKADPQAQNVIAPYFISVVDASRNGDWTKADEANKNSRISKTWGQKMYFQMRVK